jgi:hypothetical protein
MREKHRVDRFGTESAKIGELPAAALIQSTVNEIGAVGGFDLIAAPAYLAGSSTRMNNEWCVAINEFVGSAGGRVLVLSICVGFWSSIAGWRGSVHA